MSETIDEMLAASENIGVDDDKLSTVAKLATQQILEEDYIAGLEQQLKDRKAALHKLKTETIPDFMDEVGLASFALSNGATIKVEPFYQCSIPKDRKDEAFRWLTDHDYEDLIKVVVAIKFGKSEYPIALQLCEELEKLGHPAVPVLNVHPMTLKGWVRMMAEEANEFPLDLFGAFIGRTTKLK